MDGGGREHGTLSRFARLRGGTASAGRAFAPAGLIRLRLPLIARRPFRMAVRQARGMLDGRVTPPKRASLILSAGVLGSTLAYGMTVSGELGTVADTAASKAGFAIADVRLSGAVETDIGSIGKAVGLGRTASVAAIDVDEARRQLLSLPWVQSAKVRKEYPHTLAVTVEERQAVALWKLGDRTLLLDEDGAPIVESDGRSLPLLVGEGADAASADGLALFAAVPAVTPQIKALVRVGSRRWDMVTHRNVVVMLPADAPETALAILADLHADQSVLDKDLAAIDLRVPGRLALRLTPEGADLRAEALAEAAAERKKTRKLREVAL